MPALILHSFLIQTRGQRRRQTTTSQPIACTTKAFLERYPRPFCFNWPPVTRGRSHANDAESKCQKGRDNPGSDPGVCCLVQDVIIYIVVWTTTRHVHTVALSPPLTQRYNAINTSDWWYHFGSSFNGVLGLNPASEGHYVYRYGGACQKWQCFIFDLHPTMFTTSKAIAL